MRIKWTASPEWSGEVAVIVGGGPSVADQDLSLVRNRKLIVINSSYELFPTADFLYFADSRWWQEHHNRPAYLAFQGRVITTTLAVKEKRLLRMGRVNPPGLATQRDTLVMRRTSLTAAINLAVHLGVRACVLLGIDGKVAKDGKSHHHSPHPWKPVANCWRDQAEDIATLVKPLKQLGVLVWNASPESALTLWPVCSLGEALGRADEASTIS